MERSFFEGILSFYGRRRRISFFLVNLAGNIFLLGATLLAVFILGPIVGFDAFPGAEAAAAQPKTEVDTTLLTVAVVLALALVAIFVVSLWITLSNYWQRLHDMNASGWFSLVFLVIYGVLPGIGMLSGLALLLIPGTKGPNRFGEDPRSLA